MNIHRKIGFFYRIYDEITRWIPNFKPKATSKEYFEKRQRVMCIRNRLHCLHCKLNPYKNLQQCKEMKFLILWSEEFSRTVVHKKRCDYTLTQIEVRYKSNFKMDKIWYKLPFGNCSFGSVPASYGACNSDYPADSLCRRICRTFTAFKFSSLQKLEYFWYEVFRARFDEDCALEGCDAGLICNLLWTMQ